MSVDWSRIAEPQEDGYDTRVALELAKSNTLAGFRPIVGTPVDSHATTFDGQVFLHHHTDPCPYDDLDNAPLDAPAIPRAVGLLTLWPAMYRQVQALVHTLQPLADPSLEAGATGSCSGCSPRAFGLIYATVEHPVTLAEAIVHETAHAKLHALGIGTHRATRLFTNDEGTLYESPVIRDRPRPMPAVFHAEYTFCHMAWLDILLLREAPAADHPLLTSLLAYSLVRVKRGLSLVLDHAELDADGEVFMAGFEAWARSVLEQGDALLASHRHPGSVLPPVTYALGAP